MKFQTLGLLLAVVLVGCKRDKSTSAVDPVEAVATTQERLKSIDRQALEEAGKGKKN